MNNDTNPVANQIEGLTGGSLANKVDAPKETSVPVDVNGDQQGVLPEPTSAPNVGGSLNPQDNTPAEMQQPVVNTTPVAQPQVDSLENVQDPVSYSRRRFATVTPYMVTMPNGDVFETDSLDREKIMYDYLSQLRNVPGVYGMTESSKKKKGYSWQDRLEQARGAIPESDMDLRKQLVDTANVGYFGYTEIPEGIRESFFGAAGRGAVNTITSLPFDVANLYNIIAIGSTSDPEAQAEIQKRIENTIKYKNDLTAHPSAYWVDVENTGWQKWGAGVGSTAASVLPAFMTGGASFAVNSAGKAGLKAATKAATKRLGKDVTKEAAENMAKRAVNIKSFARSSKFDPLNAKETLAVTYANRIANASNYLIAAGEAANASVNVYLDTLQKTNNIDLAVGNALKAGSIVGVLGAAPEWAHGSFGALMNTSGKMWKAALAGDKGKLARMVAGDVAFAAGAEDVSEVLQNYTEAAYTNQPLDPSDQFMTFLLAGVMAGGMTTISNYSTPSRAIEAGKEYKNNLRTYVQSMTAAYNAAKPEGARLLTDDDISLFMDIVDSPNFNEQAKNIVKKGILENVNKMDGMPDEDKRAFMELLQNPDLDVSARSFQEFDKNIDDNILSNTSNLTGAQKAIFKSILHGVARFGILSGRISNPNELLAGIGPSAFTTGGAYSYTENGNVNIATENNINLNPYNAGKAEIKEGQDAALQTSARINNQIQNSATKGMSQGAVDILHEVLGHVFASDVLSKGDLPHFLIRYTELLEEAIKEVMPSADIENATPEELDEYRAYAMANSNKIAEMLGFKGNTAQLFNFFEQMTLADSANFGVIQDYVKTLRALMESNSESIRDLIDIYGEDLPYAIKNFAKTGELGVLTNEDLKTLSRVLNSGLVDADSKLDLMSVFGDSDTYQSLNDRLGEYWNTAVAQDKANVKRQFNDAVQTAKETVQNAPDAPINEEAVETLEILEQDAQQEQPAPVEETQQPEVDNAVTFDGKKYYYLTKKKLLMPAQEAVKDVKHTKQNGEPQSEGKETYRASQLATTGLTKEELDGMTNFALGEIKKLQPGIYDELIKQINGIADSDVPLVAMELHDEQGRLSGYMFKYIGEIPVGNSKLRFTKNNIFSNANGKTSALSSDIAYYIMARRAAKNDNRRYSARAISDAVRGYLESTDYKDTELDAAYAKLAAYEDQYQAFTGNLDSDTRELRSILEDINAALVDNNIDIMVTDDRALRGDRLERSANWYAKFYENVTNASLDNAKHLVKKNLKLDNNEVAELDKLQSRDDVVSFLENHANQYKYLYKVKRYSDSRHLSDIVQEEIDNLAQDENAERRDVTSYVPDKKLSTQQKKRVVAGVNMAKAQTDEERAKATSEYLRATPEPTEANDTPENIFTSVKIDSLFSKSGYKKYTPITNYIAQIGYAENKARLAEADGSEDVGLEIKGTMPEDYGFQDPSQMYSVFDEYGIPAVKFDTEAYLNKERVGKLRQKKKWFTSTEFLRDYAEMARQQVQEIIGNKDVLSPKDKLTYVRAVIDSYVAGKKAYDEYVERSAVTDYRTSKDGNQLLSPEGYEKYSSVESAINDGDIRNMDLFTGMDKSMFEGYDPEYLKMYPSVNTGDLKLGTVVRFPYGKTPKTGMVVLDMRIPRSFIGDVPNRIYLIRTASKGVKEGKEYTKYEEFFIPRSDFEEMFDTDGKAIMVSDVVFGEGFLDEFNKNFDQKLVAQGAKTIKRSEAVEAIEDANSKRSQLQMGESPQSFYERRESVEQFNNGRHYAAHEEVTQGMADLLKRLTPADEELNPDLSQEELELAREYGLSRNLRDFAYRTMDFGEELNAQDFKNIYEAEQLSKELGKKTVVEFAEEPFMGIQNISEYINGLSEKAAAARAGNKWVHKIPLFLGSMSGTDRIWSMVFGGEDPLAMSLVQSAQRMVQDSELATEHLQAQIAKILKEKGNGAKSYNEFFRSRLMNSPIQAEIYDGNNVKKVDIRRGEIHTLYAAWLIENTKHPNDPSKYKYEQHAIDGGNKIYTRLKDTMYKNADKLIEQLTPLEKDVIKGMLDFFTSYCGHHNKRFVLSLGSYTKTVKNDWALRQQYFTRATKAEMTDLNSLLVAGDLFDTMNGDFKANAIYESGVKKNLTLMKNMLLFGLNYSNAEDGLSGYERFLKDFRLRGDLNPESEDFQAYKGLINASNKLREEVRQTLGKNGFERFMKRLEQEESNTENAFKLLSTGVGKFIERTTRASMASALAFKPKNALQNFAGAWQRMAPLADSTGKWYTSDLLDCIFHIKDAIESAKDNSFIMHRISRNALGEEYQKVTDVSATESYLSELSVWAANAKKKGGVPLSEIFGKLDDFAKKMTKVSVGYGTSGADFLALAFGWYKLKGSLQKQALELNKANAKALNGKAQVTAETLFMNHVLRNISSSNFMTRSPLQNWAIRNHLGAITAFLNDSLQSYGAIGEAWYNLHNAKTDAEKRYYRRVIASNVASQVFYVATQIGAFSALYGWVATDDGLTDAEQEYLVSALWRETIGQISSMTPYDGFSRPILEALFLKEKRQSGNIWTSTFQDLAAAIHDGDIAKTIAASADLAGFAGTLRTLDFADAMWSAYSKDDQSYKIAGEVAFGRTPNTALKAQGLRKNSKGEVVEKKKKSKKE